ncbi:MAG: murein biosynthesis integral membrane protein MurJ [Kiritimatiellae bacterium]|nr:murein biosynthesis integral membrane protein MurJ [Kiritimatiellia bacterium]
MTQSTPQSENAVQPRVLRSVSVVSMMTAVSRVLGLAREVAMAYFFGTSALKSAFDIAFVVPNLFRRLFGEGALSSAFVPVFSETMVKEGRKQAYAFARRLITLLVLFLGAVTLAGILLSYPLAAILPAESRWLLPLPMLRIMLPYALLICVAALVSGMLNTLGKFAISSLTPFLLNLIWLATLFGVFPFIRDLPERRIMVLSWAVLLAGLAQLLFQLPALARSGFRFSLCFKELRSDPKLLRVLRLMGPAALGIGLIQINVCVDKMLSFWADPGAPAMLEYAERLIYLPLGMFGTAFMTVLLPTFSKQVASGDLAGMRGTLERAIRNLAVIMAPCSVALAVLSLPIIELIYSFKGGQFGPEAAVLSARALAAYAPGLLFFSFQKAVIPAFYGMQDLRTPVRVSMFGLALNITLNVTSVLFLPHGWKHAGIAGSTVVTSMVNGLTLAVILHRRHGSPRAGAVLVPVLKSVACALLMALAARAVFAACGGGFIGAVPEGKLGQVAVMTVTVAAGIAVYGGLMALVSRAELVEMAGELLGRKKLRRGGNG